MTPQPKYLESSISSPSNEGRKIELLEKEFLKLPQATCSVTHRFGPGLYIREVKIPAGTYAIGHHQNLEHMNILLEGRVTIRNEDGSSVDLRAPMIFLGKPGRKVGLVHEDMTWLNIYATDETDIEKLEKTYLTKSCNWTNSADEKVALQLTNDFDLKDFEAALREIGVTKEIVRSQSENETDMVRLPHGNYKFKVATSKIEGRGVISMGDIVSGEKIGPARIAGQRTLLGRFTNHSGVPNARMVRGIGSDIDLIAIRNIEGCRGGMDGQEITINYREAYALTLEIGRTE